MEFSNRGHLLFIASKHHPTEIMTWLILIWWIRSSEHPRSTLGHTFSRLKTTMRPNTNPWIRWSFSPEHRMKEKGNAIL